VGPAVSVMVGTGAAGARFETCMAMTIRIRRAIASATAYRAQGGNCCIGPPYACDIRTRDICSLFSIPCHTQDRQCRAGTQEKAVPSLNFELSPTASTLGINSRPTKGCKQEDSHARNSGWQQQQAFLACCRSASRACEALPITGYPHDRHLRSSAAPMIGSRSLVALHPHWCWR
jgi:hypothetical protein